MQYFKVDIFIYLCKYGGSVGSGNKGCEVVCLFDCFVGIGVPVRLNIYFPLHTYVRTDVFSITGLNELLLVVVELLLEMDNSNAECCRPSICTCDNIR
jgi:hypothetical protein